MSIDFHVSGRTAIQTDAVFSGTFVTIGYLDSDELIEVVQSVRNVLLRSSREGQTVVDAIYAGSNIDMSVLLVEWDEVEKDEVMQVPGATVQGDLGTPGSLWSATNFFQTRIMPVTAAGANAPSATRPAYTFPNCIIDGDDGLRLFDIGVKETRLSFNVMCLPDSNGNLYTIATA